MKALEGNGDNDNDDEESIDEDETQTNGADQLDDFMKLQTDSVGIKLKGPAATTARYPLQFRYYFQHVSDQNAVVRQWEDQILGKNTTIGVTTSPSVLNSRVFCSRARSYPCMVFSVIKYDAGEEKAKIQKLIAEDHKGLEVFDLPRRDWRGFSYKPLFKTVVEEKSGDHFFEKGYLYDPDNLDDPSMLHGAHRYVLQRKAATGPILSSIIHFVNKADLKESLNEKFRERHPNLPPSLTLSKIRNLKKETLLTCVSIGIEISTVAIAMINFERLCMKSLVTKYNRRLSMAVSLLLAVKFNETVYDDYHGMLNALLSFFDREWDLPKKQVFEAEFGAFVHLGFTLQLPFHHVYLMYSRLLKLLNETSKHYLGETMNDIYVQDVIAQERQRAQTRNKQRERERENREQQQQQQQRARGGSVGSSNSESATVRRPRRVAKSTSSGTVATGAGAEAAAVTIPLPRPSMLLHIPSPVPEYPTQSDAAAAEDEQEHEYVTESETSPNPAHDPWAEEPTQRCSDSAMSPSADAGEDHHRKKSGVFDKISALIPSSILR